MTMQSTRSSSEYDVLLSTAPDMNYESFSHLVPYLSSETLLRWTKATKDPEYNTLAHTLLGPNSFSQNVRLVCLTGRTDLLLPNYMREWKQEMTNMSYEEWMTLAFQVDYATLQSMAKDIFFPNIPYARESPVCSFLEQVYLTTTDVRKMAFVVSKRLNQYVPFLTQLVVLELNINKFQCFVHGLVDADPKNRDEALEMVLRCMYEYRISMRAGTERLPGSDEDEDIFSDAMQAPVIAFGKETWCIVYCSGDPEGLLTRVFNTLQKHLSDLWTSYKRSYGEDVLTDIFDSLPITLQSEKLKQHVIRLDIMSWPRSRKIN